MDDHPDDMRPILVAIQAGVTDLATDMRTLTTAFADLKTDVSTLTTDVADLKTDVSTLKAGQARAETRIDDLRTTLLEFRTSTAHDMETMHRRIDDLRDTLNGRMLTVETGIMHSIRDLVRESTSRHNHVETRMAEIEREVHSGPTGRPPDQTG